MDAHLNDEQHEIGTQGQNQRAAATLTGFNEPILQQLISDNVTFKEMFSKARMNPDAHLITGVICGYRAEDLENRLIQKVRYLDKLVDELAMSASPKRG